MIASNQESVPGKVLRLKSGKTKGYSRTKKLKDVIQKLNKPHREEELPKNNTLIYTKTKTLYMKHFYRSSSRMALFSLNSLSHSLKSREARDYPLDVCLAKLNS